MIMFMPLYRAANGHSGPPILPKDPIERAAFLQRMRGLVENVRENSEILRIRDRRMDEGVCAVYEVSSANHDGVTYKAALGGWVGPVTKSEMATTLREITIVSNANLDGAVLRIFFGEARDERASPQPPLGPA